jgi:hypothetical protein
VILIASSRVVLTFVKNSAIVNDKLADVTNGEFSPPMTSATCATRLVACNLSVITLVRVSWSVSNLRSILVSIFVSRILLVVILLKLNKLHAFPRR